MRKIFFYTMFLVMISNGLYAGFGSDYSERSYNRFKYDVDGEIEVKPDFAVYPISVSVKSRSYLSSLSYAKKILNRIERDINKLKSKDYTIEKSGFKKSGSSKSLKISFFGKSESSRTASLDFHIKVNFKEKYDFWKRAELVAEVLDFINKMQRIYSNGDNVRIYSRNAVFHIRNIEKYREKIIESIYKKAKVTCDVIEKNEKTKLEISHMTFGQNISKQIVNLIRAKLTIKASMEFRKK